MTSIIETIPDQDAIHRLIDFPNMYDDKNGFIWHNIFQFPQGLPESVMWGKYACTAASIHGLGIAREAAKQQAKPNMRYLGFISAGAVEIRSITTRLGHGFSLVHAPSEGIQHAEISYKPNGAMSRNEKSELKVALKKVFGPLIKRS